MSVLELDDVSFAYGDRPVLEDVSLTVERGDFLGVVGPNGSGKTTLLRLALGLDAPDEGSVSLFGTPATVFADGTRVGYVAQRTAAATEMPITVREVVRMGRYPHLGLGRFGRADRERVAAAMETVGVESLADRRVSALSGGQRQRVFLARALAGDAELLVLDEPAVGVDTESREAFYGLLGELNADGLAVVLVEHDVGVVTTFADSVACLNRRLYFHGDTVSFAESDALREAYGANQRLLDHRH